MLKGELRLRDPSGEENDRPNRVASEKNDEKIVNFLINGGKKKIL